MTSRRFDSAPRAIARLQRRLDDLWKLASRKGHGHVLGYAEVTSDQTGITTETDLTGLSVTVTVPAGRRLKLTYQGHHENDISDNRVIVRIKEGAAFLNFVYTHHGEAGSAARVTALGAAVITPSAGSHTYKATMQSPDAGNASLRASSNLPAFFLVEDIGPA